MKAPRRFRPVYRTVCHAVHKAREGLTINHLFPMCFTSKKAARECCRRMHHAGLLCGYCDAIHLPTRWYLDRRGHELLSLDEPFVSPARRHRRGPLLREHRDLCLLAWSQFVTRCHHHDEAQLARYLLEHELSEGGIWGPGYRPDSVVSVGQDGLAIHGVVEVDTGSESPTQVARKIAQLTALVISHTPIAQVRVQCMLLLLPSLRRARSIARACGRPRIPVLCCVFSCKQPELSLLDGWIDLRAVLADEPRTHGLFDFVQRRS